MKQKQKHKVLAYPVSNKLSVCATTLPRHSTRWQITPGYKARKIFDYDAPREVLLKYLARDTSQLQARVDYCVVTILSRVHASRIQLISNWRDVQQTARQYSDLLSADDLDTDMCGDLIAPISKLGQSLPTSVEDAIDDCFHAWQRPWGLYFGDTSPDWYVAMPESITESSSMSETMGSFVAAIASYDSSISFPFGHTPVSMTPATASLLEEAVRKNPNLK